MPQLDPSDVYPVWRWLYGDTHGGLACGPNRAKATGAVLRQLRREWREAGARFPGPQGLSRHLSLDLVRARTVTAQGPRVLSSWELGATRYTATEVVLEAHRARARGEG